ncbi:MAG: hypothetical protein GX361_08745, partial [Bacteroidales bacterium]|nr:hypothetical protein [Bacteroidales bacterium]
MTKKLSFTLKRQKMLLIALLLVPFVMYGQYITTADSVAFFDPLAAADTLNMSSMQESQDNVISDTQHFYQWETPILEKIDLKSIEQYKDNHESYLAELELLEDMLKKNKKELNAYYQQAKDHAKVLKNEKKNLKEKRKFYEQDQKLAKREKKLRDRELKLIKKERKALKKHSKTMSNWDVEEKMRKFDDREYRIEEAEQRWQEKRAATQRNLEILAEDERVLNQRQL